jgi:hypothetical protein
MPKEEDNMENYAYRLFKPWLQAEGIFDHFMDQAQRGS